MEDGSYKASMVEEVSIGDWIRLNFDAVDQQLLHATSPNGFLLQGEDYEAGGQEPPEEPEEPDEGDFDSKEEYEKAHATYQTAYDEYEEAQQEMDESEGFPTWNTMWCALDRPGTAERLVACGFSVYRFLSGALGEVFDGELVFGVDGAGYSFYGAHWIPLRALILKHRNDEGYLETDKYQAAIALLLEQAEQEGDRNRVQRILADDAE